MIKSITEKLYSTSLAFTNSLTDEFIKEKVAVYGYDEVRLNEGKTLYDEAVAEQTAKV